MKVSVIVPVYNAEKYFEKCLNSLVNQTLKDIEIIVVNDGSTDNSEKILKKFLAKYKNIVYFKKENSGQSDARNLGISHAKGDYLGFIDSDDYIALDMFEKLYNKAISDDFDFVSCDVDYIYPNYDKTVDCLIKNDTDNMHSLLINIYPIVCNKIFKRDLFANKDVRFKKGVWYEDVEFIYRIIPFLKKVGVIHESLYYYVQHEGSVIHSYNERVYDYIANMNGLLDFYQKNGFYEIYHQEFDYAYVRYLYATFVRTATAFPKEEYVKAVNIAIKNVQEHVPHYRKNKYFYKSIKGLYLLSFNKVLSRIIYILKKQK